MNTDRSLEHSISTVNKSSFSTTERENYDIDENLVVIDIRPYVFEPLALSNKENASTSSEESEGEADGNRELRLNGTIWYD